MCRRYLILLLILATSTASAQYEDEEEEEKKRRPKLEGSSRISFQTGWRYTPNTRLFDDYYSHWRYTPNTRLFDDYYSHPENSDLPRAGGAIGGPLLTGTFAYSPYEWFEMGIDLSATYERIRITDQPGLNTLTFAAQFGLRFQKRLELGSEGLIPFGGILLGPMFTAAYFDGGHSVENFLQAPALAAGATLRLGKEWGFCFEYRFLLARGVAEELGLYNAGGHWLSLGLTYTFPIAPDRRLSGRY